MRSGSRDFGERHRTHIRCPNGLGQSMLRLAHMNDE